MLNSYKKFQRWYGSLEPRPAGDGGCAASDECGWEASATDVQSSGTGAPQVAELSEAPVQSEMPVECSVPGYPAPELCGKPRRTGFTGEWTDWLAEQDIPEHGGEVVRFPGPRGDAHQETRGLPAGLRAVLGAVLGAGTVAGFLTQLGVVG